jgi:hypothetical protein
MSITGIGYLLLYFFTLNLLENEKNAIKCVRNKSSL